MKKIIPFIIAFTLQSFLLAQNIMHIPNVSGDANNTILVNLEINNADEFVAFQTDITLPAQVTYLANSASLTGRKSDHSLSANVINGNILRIIAFSINQNPFSGNSGSVLTYELVLKTIPGIYTLQMSNSIISDENSTNIITSFVNGQLTLYAPDVDLSTGSINFGEIPLLQNNTRQFTIYNYGNVTLNVSRVANTIEYFEVIGDTLFSISPGSNRSVSVRFNSVEKGVYANKIQIYSNDPDEALKEINTTATAFAVNELHGLSASGRSGYPVEVEFTMNNMEGITGFQFDIVLPSVLTFIPDSIFLSERKVDHVISASQISSNRLRVVSYSPSNNTFTGNDGQLLSAKFNLDGTGGNHNYNLENVVLSDGSAENVVSDYSSSYVNVASPDINGNGIINFSEVSVVDSANVIYQISNTGNDTLKITSITSNNPSFWTNFESLLIIQQGTSENLSVSFHNSQKNTHTGRLTLRSNDPDEDPFYVNLTANAFAPNYIGVGDTSGFKNTEVILEINIDNHEQFTAFQVDIDVPENFTYVDNSAVLTDRKQDHSISVSVVGTNKIRVISFSMTGKVFEENTGAVAQLSFMADCNAGDYELTLSSGILSDQSSNNILYALHNGSLEIKENIVINAKVFLEGPYNAGTMQASLTNIPLSQPYNAAPWNYVGTESVEEIPVDVVDWVLIELRSNTTTAINKYACFLKTDGSIVDLTGTGLINFPENSGNYYLVIHHRNHLSIMSQSALSLNTNSESYDFTTNTSKAYGTNSLKDLGNDTWGMKSGDSNASKIVTFADILFAIPSLNSTDYNSADINLSGIVTIADLLKIIPNNNSSSNVPEN
ncbi:MAG: choice-of-anchor D domain-containing protein [Melioribacteraceae bacterium]|nr:MAG: choice-of-anchor D domain-containing protein [Melioribacteraceae bacterium]